MNEATEKAVQLIIDNFEATFWRFTEIQELPDSPAVRVGFYTILETIITRDPIPDWRVQRELLLYLAKTKIKAMEADEEDIEKLVVTVSQASLRSRKTVV